MEPVAEREPPSAARCGPSDSISHDSQQPQTVHAGKLRKTALRFFSGRKSICMLPSFFGGRGKSQGRGSTKGGVTKSQTYDGVSRACWEGGSGGSDVISAEFEYHDPNGSSGTLRAQEGLAKSQSLPRQKRGLRGLFSSIRKRRNRNAESEKTEAFEMCSGEIMPVVSQSRRHDDSSPGGSVPADVGEFPMPPVSGADKCTTDEMLSLGKQRGEENIEEDDGKGDDKEEEAERKRKSTLVLYRQPLSAVSEMSRLADLPRDDPPSISASSDNLVFGDVSSLKSFDSLTGCGDNIADQDDVSMAESSVSGERGSRNAGKRSSCLVTYQGGGEEMATPDEAADEYLTSLWESEGSEVCYLPSEQIVTPDLPTSSFQVTTSSGDTSASPLGITDTVLTPTDLLTPQSDRQGSVPNSDEGYYGSTTPGADEETRERPQQERLPRDSYSGDALYELFEPDDQLLSPSLPLKDSRGSLSGGKSQGDLFFSVTSTDLGTGAMETEEERLSKIQHALLCRELQNLRIPAEDQILYCGDCFYDDPNPPESACDRSVKEPLPQQWSRALYEPAADLRLSPQGSKTPSPLQEAGLDSEREQGEVSDDGSLPPTRGCSQSQEELMVCFSQALVDFTKSSHRYRNSTESLDGSESSSPFGPSLNALPAIVTFDVVDMENEGESEQPELVDEEEEDLAPPYEAFEDDGCYLQQDAFAECDQRTFDAYEQSLLVGSTWGITSLPRHLSLARPCPPVPAPLSLNRRSRSLDTDGLELQPGELYASVVSHRRKEMGALAGRDAQMREFDRSQKSSPWMEPTSSITSSHQSAVRPSHLPLQAAYHNRGMARNAKANAEGDSPTSGRGDLYPCSHPQAGAQWKSRLVGSTQGIPHLQADQSEAVREITAKSRRTDNERFPAAVQK